MPAVGFFYFCEELFDLLVGLGSSFYDFLFLPTKEFLSGSDSIVLNFIYDTFLDYPLFDWINSVSFATLIFGSGVISLISIFVVYTIIPFLD